jgi:hypothetical protein
MFIDIVLNYINNYFYSNTEYIKRGIFLSCIFLFILLCIVIFSIILFIAVTYIIFKKVKSNIDNSGILFYQYNKKSRATLEKYGDYEIKKIYLIRQPFTKLMTLILNILTFYNYNKIVNHSNIFPYHTLLVFEIKLPKNKRKFILLEKNNSINICQDFTIQNTQDMKFINIKNKTTINKILSTTQERIGDTNYYNWNLFTNNCIKFIKEILITTGNYNDSCKEFIQEENVNDVFIKTTFIPSDFSIHIINSVVNIYNFTEKYLLDNDFVFF